MRVNIPGTGSDAFPDPRCRPDTTARPNPRPETDVLIVGSGAIVHNLRAIAREGTPAPDWARTVDDFIVTAIESGDAVSDLSFARPRRRRIFFGSYF